jgi:hypothetical protein
MKIRVFGATLAVLCLCANVALADPTPAPGISLPNIPGVPSSVLNNPTVQSIINAVGGTLLQTTNGPTARGKVTYFKRFDLQLQTAPGVYRQVRLHQGTVINPRGADIRPGQTLDVAGDAQSDGTLDANTITVQ